MTSNVIQIIEPLSAHPEKTVHDLIICKNSTISECHHATRAILSSFSFKQSPLSLQDQLIATQLMCILCSLRGHAMAFLKPGYHLPIDMLVISHEVARTSDLPRTPPAAPTKGNPLIPSIRNPLLTILPPNPTSTPSES
jgi:hypothetical protein